MNAFCASCACVLYNGFEYLSTYFFVCLQNFGIVFFVSTKSVIQILLKASSKNSPPDKLLSCVFGEPPSFWESSLPEHLAKTTFPQLRFPTSFSPIICGISWQKVLGSPFLLQSYGLFLVKSVLYLLFVESEISVCFAIWFRGDWWWSVFVSRNFTIKLCKYSRSSDLEPNFSVLDPESVVEVEDFCTDQILIFSSIEKDEEVYIHWNETSWSDYYISI